MNPTSLTPFARFGLAALLSVLLLHAAPAPAESAAETVIRTTGIDPGDLAKLDKGDIVSFDVAEATGKSLASGIAMMVKAKPAKVAELVRQGKLIVADPDVIAHGTLAPNAGPGAFAKFAYGKADADEAEDLLDAAPGTDFNLSTEEIAAFAALRRNGAADGGKAAAVSATYRKVLAERLQAYRRSGLRGIAPYDRGDGERADPAAELTTDTRESKGLAQTFPALHQALLDYPSGLPSGTDSVFLWFNRRVENRPTPVLAHRLMYVSNEGAVMVQREFYVGHSYNSSQAVAGSVPYRDGALLFYAMRSSTDHVTGMGQSLKHSIGREAVRKEVVKKFQRLKAALKG